jgi:hypothetical protein
LFDTGLNIGSTPVRKFNEIMGAVLFKWLEVEGR